MKDRKKHLKKECDKLWYLKCLEIHGNKCVVCGEPAVQVHHFFPKGLYPQLRYEIENGVPLCMKHHRLIHDQPKTIKIYG